MINACKFNPRATFFAPAAELYPAARIGQVIGLAAVFGGFDAKNGTACAHDGLFRAQGRHDG
jgi:hypothetical protein